MIFTPPEQSVPSNNPNAFFKYSAKQFEDPKIIPANDNRRQRAWMLRKHYWNLTTALIRNNMSFSNIVRHQYPLLLSTSKLPLALAIEFTNHCNIACSYCTNSTDVRAKGYMKDDTFYKMINEIEKNKIKRISIVGNGEPTLHPHFNKYLTALKKASKLILLTSNMQSVNNETLNTIAKTVNIINISVDGYDSNTYEKFRHNAIFNKLISNINKLKKIKNETNSSISINIRIMIHPSNRKDLLKMKAFWGEYSNHTSTQYVLNYKHNRDDVYDFNTNEEFYPECSLPFKKLDIHWDGNVPLCSYYYMQANNPSQYLLGNINSNELINLWNHELLNYYRDGHRKRNKQKIPMCAGCMGC